MPSIRSEMVPEYRISHPAGSRPFLSAVPGEQMNPGSLVVARQHDGAGHLGEGG
jgi:hypothetical protein